MKKILYTTSLVSLPSSFKRWIYGGNIMLYRISVAERGLTGIASIFHSRLSRLDDLLRAGTVPLTLAPAGWLISTPPPYGFSQIAKKTVARSAAKFAIAVQPTIWHISKKTMTRWPQRSRDQVAWSDLTSSCVFRSLTSCQRHTSDPNSLKLAMYSKGIGVYNLYISDFSYRWPKVMSISWPPHCKSMVKK